MSDVQIFCVDPEMIPIIQNFDTPQDDNDVSENTTTLNTRQELKHDNNEHTTTVKNTTKVKTRSDCKHDKSGHTTRLQKNSLTLKGHFGITAPLQDRRNIRLSQAKVPFGDY